MRGRVVLVSDGYRVEGCGANGELVNQSFAHPTGHCDPLTLVRPAAVMP
jgi:hypothetical protein